MRCHERTCDCGAVVAAWTTILRPGRPPATMCLNCLDLDALHADTESGLVERTCEHCRNLFTDEIEHASFFCSLACEADWKAAQTFDEIPY